MSVASQSPESLRGAPAVDAELDLPALGAALWRKKWKILGPTVLVGLLALVVVQLITPRFQSEARVLIEVRDNFYLRPEADKDTIDRNVVDEQAVTSQVQLVLSRDLARDVIAKLKLGERPEFDPVLAGISPIKAILGKIGLIKDPTSMTPEERVLEAYYDRLTVYAVEKSRVIVINFVSEDPELAAEVANAVASGYLVLQERARQEQARTAGQWLSGEIDNMRTRVAEAEAKVEAFRAKTNLFVGNNNTTLSAQQLGDVNTQIATARAQKADAEARSHLIRDMLKSGAPIESSDILNSELIRRLSEQRVTLRAQLAEQSSSLLDGHPRIKELRAQIADLDRQIRAEAETIARSLENDAKIAGARLDSQMASLEQLKSQAATTNEQDVQLRALEREAKAQRDLLESYLAKYREATARDTPNSSPADARIISRATPSNIPAYPKKLPTILIASLATFVLCCGMVLTKELLAAPIGFPAWTGARRQAEIEPEIVAPSIAPDEPRPFGSRESLITKILKPASRAGEPPLLKTPEPKGEAKETPTHRSEAPLTEAHRPEVRHAVGIPVSAIEDVAYSLRQADSTDGRIAIFGAVDAIDTSRTALSVARALAGDSRVVLIGLGFVDAAIKAASTDPAAGGLAELAAGTASFRDIITRDRYSELHLISSGRTPTDRLDILSSQGMTISFDALARSYDYVVVDAGSALGSDLNVIREIAVHAILVSETLSNASTVSARDRLMAAGFDDVMMLVGARAGARRATAAAAA
jgi:polysaccharide biosynthesis transport protein